MYQKKCYIGKGTICEYGNKVTYSIDNENNISLKGTNGVEISYKNGKLMKDDGNNCATGNDESPTEGETDITQDVRWKNLFGNIPSYENYYRSNACE